MIETTLAAGDLLTAIPGLWDAARIPLAIIAIAVGGVSGAFSLTRGFGAAAGKVAANGGGMHRTRSRPAGGSAAASCRASSAVSATTRATCAAARCT